eukprot:s397_g20.t1
MSGIEEELGALELRGVSDVHDCSIDHLCQIGALIASPQGMRSSEGGRQDTWEVNETELKLIRHVNVWRNEMLDHWRTTDAQGLPRWVDCYCQRCQVPDNDEYQAT